MLRTLTHAASLIALLALASCTGSKPPPPTGATELTKSVSRSVGTQGSTFGFIGGNISIPPGSLAGETAITISQTGEAAPTGYSVLSPVYKFEPSGLVFQSPVTVTLQYSAGLRSPVVLWSKADGTGFDEIAGTVGDGTITVTVNHFSTAFVANAVAASLPEPTMGATEPVPTGSPVPSMTPTNPPAGDPTMTPTEVPNSCNPLDELGAFHAARQALRLKLMSGDCAADTSAQYVVGVLDAEPYPLQNQPTGTLFDCKGAWCFHWMGDANGYCRNANWFTGNCTTCSAASTCY